MAKIRLRAIAQVKAFTEEGKYALAEINGIKEGDLLIGRVNPTNDDCFEFKINGNDAVLYNGVNCVITETEAISYWVKHDGDLEEFENLYDAREFADRFDDSQLLYGSEVSDLNGRTTVAIYLCKSLAEARKCVLKELCERSFVNTL